MVGYQFAPYDPAGSAGVAIPFVDLSSPFGIPWITRISSCPSSLSFFIIKIVLICRMIRPLKRVEYFRMITAARYNNTRGQCVSLNWFRFSTSATTKPIVPKPTLGSCFLMGILDDRQSSILVPFDICNLCTAFTKSVSIHISVCPQGNPRFFASGALNQVKKIARLVFRNSALNYPYFLSVAHLAHDETKTSARRWLYPSRNSRLADVIKHYIQLFRDRPIIPQVVT